MEARKRLAIVASHLRPLTTTTASSASGLTTATASSDSCPARDEEADAADCVFCKIARRQSHAFVLYEDDVCLCIFDSNPLCPGHSLIIPRSHFSSLGTTPPSVVAAMCSKIPYLSDAIMKATSSDAFNLLVNNGAAAGQVIFHTHIHIIPRKTRDCLWASESLQRHSLLFDGTTSRLADTVREHLKSPDKKEDTKGQESCISKS
uniref:HIT domain-containing protein n=1 Tax=Kalanchoe fedtschenkoi TaxID=63787 RepID=A0A7N0TZP3_KALFE